MTKHALFPQQDEVIKEQHIWKMNTMYRWDFWILEPMIKNLSGREAM